MNDKENNFIIENEIIPYQELKLDVFFELASNIVDECKQYSPWILFNNNSITDITDILSCYLDFKNPFIMIEDNLESDSDEDFSS